MKTLARFTLLLPAILAMLGFAFLVRLAATPIQAAPLTTYYVAPAGDDGNDCLSPATACASVAEAVDKAGNGDTIQIAAGVYNESGITLDESLALVGEDAETTIVDGGANGRLFTIYADVTLSQLTIQNGQTPDDPDIFNSGGGGMLVSSGATVLLQDVVVQDNEAAGLGGGIFTLGHLTIDHSQILSNTAQSGGGLYTYGASGAVTTTHSVVAHNQALVSFGGGFYMSQPLLMQDTIVRDNSSPSSFGGGLTLNGPEARLERVTVTGNEATAGAGLYTQLAGVNTLVNTTVSSNFASNNYGGIYATGAGSEYVIQYSTIANNARTNTAGTGWNGIVMGSNAQATVSNSIIAGNAGNQCNATGIVSGGYNLSSDSSCALTATGDQQGVDPLLMPLADYGGPTPTHALQPHSPAVDASSNNGCPATDQRGVTRPFDGDNDGNALCDIGAVEAERQLTIGDTSLLEGTGGVNTAVFEVSLFPTSSVTITVDYATANGTAVAPGDYTATNGALTFAPGETGQTINVPVVTDADDEPDETFTVNLSNATNAAILVGAAGGTIIDDDGAPRLSIDDVTLLEGNSGTQQMVFNVTLSPSSADVVTVDYTTVNGTAMAPADFPATGDTLSFDPGETSKQISIAIAGDVIDEGSSEDFTVVLSNPGNAALEKATGLGTITDDDTARLSHGFGPVVLEGDSGTTPATFTVTLSTPASFDVTVDYAISSGCCDDGATAGTDFVGVYNGTLTFAPGETMVTYGVDVVGDQEVEPDEVFSSLISNANVPITVNGSNGTILDDDGQGSSLLYLPLILK